MRGKFVNLLQSGEWFFHNPSSIVKFFQNSLVVFLKSKCFEFSATQNFEFLQVNNQNDEIMANIKQLLILTEQKQKLSTDLLASQVVA